MWPGGYDFRIWVGNQTDVLFRARWYGYLLARGIRGIMAASHDALSRHWNINLPQSTFHPPLPEIDARVYAPAAEPHTRYKDRRPHIRRTPLPPFFHSRILWPICSGHTFTRRELGEVKKALSSYEPLKVKPFANSTSVLYSVSSEFYLNGNSTRDLIIKASIAVGLPRCETVPEETNSDRNNILPGDEELSFHFFFLSLLWLQRQWSNTLCVMIMKTQRGGNASFSSTVFAFDREEPVFVGSFHPIFVSSLSSSCGLYSC